MDYGIPTLMDLPQPEQLARYCADNGFAFVEMNMTFPWFQPGSIDVGRVRALSRDYNVGFTLHLHDQVDPFEFSPDLRRGHLNNIAFALDLACGLGLPRVNMHLMPGTYSTINGVKTYLYERCLDRYLALVREFRDRVSERLRGSPTIFCIENTSGFRDFHCQAIDLLLESPCFGLTFDIGHSFRAGGGDEKLILARRERVRHFHIHDCDAKANHLGLGEGALDVLRYLRLADSLGATVVTEVKEASALLRTKEYLIQNDLW